MSDNFNRVLVTGGAGFIGSHVIERLLSQGREVACLDIFNDFYDPAMKYINIMPFKGNPSFHLFVENIQNPFMVESVFKEFKPQAVIHLAAMAGVRPSMNNPALYAGVNVEGLVNVLEAAVKNDVKRFLFASSSSVYGNSCMVPFCENDPAIGNPVSPYAATKLAGELMCKTYRHLYGLPVTSLRFFTVYGPRQRPDLAISKFLHNVSQGLPIKIFGEGTTSRDYTYVSDVVDGIMAALGSGCDQSVLNLGSGNPVSLNDLILTIEKVTGHKAILEHEGMQPGDVDRTFADLKLSKATLGFLPRVGITEGIQRQWDWVQLERARGIEPL
jgi:UDP-glucuronate 4-epimerase